MKKMVCLVLTLVAMFTILTSASADVCQHTNTDVRLLFGEWRHLDTESEEYGTTHYRDMYTITYCVDCGTFLDSLFAGTDWGDHTLPCDECGAN